MAKGFGAVWKLGRCGETRATSRDLLEATFFACLFTKFQGGKRLESLPALIYRGGLSGFG
jgi:hypothetical protein